MSQRFRTLFCCLFLEVGALAGVPMRPEQIRELMQALNKSAVVETDPQAADGGDACGSGDLR